MDNRRLLFLTLIIATLTIGVVIGTIVSGRVEAEQQTPETLTIPDPVSLSNVFSQIAATLEPAVVNINTEATVNLRSRQGNQVPSIPDPFDFFDFFGRRDENPDFRTRNLGTGFILDEEGYIVTNHHVVDRADKITVRLWDESEYEARVIGSDPETDIAVIKIDADRDLVAAEMGNSDAVEVGDWVLAIGSPFNFDHTVTAGIISAKGRENIGPNVRQFQTFLQTDAAINPGNSGGPLVNMAGEVIGVNTAIISETRQFAGLGFALPSNIASRVYNQLVQNGKVTRGSIGIQYTGNPDPSLFRAFGLEPSTGVVIDAVVPGSPASRAGLSAGDIITAIDGTQITNGSELLDVVANSPVGQTIQIQVNRNGREQTIPVTIGDRETVLSDLSSNDVPGDNNREESETRVGIRVQNITPDMMQQFGLPSSEGVIITSVESNSIAEEAGFVRGMVITRVVVDGQWIEVAGIGDFSRAERLFRSGSNVAFMVLRRDPRNNEYTSGFVPLTIP